MHKDTRYINSSISDISPKVLFASHFNSEGLLKKGERMQERFCYDYELELYTSSNDGGIIVEGTYYPVYENTIMLRKPGQLVQGIAAYSCYIICFDLAGKMDKVHNGYNFTKAQTLLDYHCNPLLQALPVLNLLGHPQEYYPHFESIQKAYLDNSPVSELMMKSELLQILLKLYQESSRAREVAPKHYALIKKSLDHMQTHYNQKITLERLGKITGLSPNYYHKLFKEAAQITPAEYLIQIRLNIAKTRLIKEMTPVAQIALSCGFENSSYFYDLFKKRIGITPLQYRKLHQGNLEALFPVE